ncbi:acetyl esterase/lipase [Balneicella halophila]|uniref:Acetyl esterase/lipase n=1 Tax=Balneicella halophila TaxID=1537566 RepID=A0A7L4UR98_BALHA|nr:acetyl esterase/lipase [Balneicella halophila]
MNKCNQHRRILLVLSTFILSSCSSYRVKTDSQENKKIFNISYGDDKQQKMDVFIPKDTRDAAFVIIVHGGGWSIGKKWHIRSIQKFFLKNGIPSANIDYRLVKKGTTYKDQVEDLAKATRYVMENFHKDEDIIVLGESSGGHISMMYGYNNPNIVDKIITFAGPADLYSENYENTRLYKKYTEGVFKKIVGKKGESFEDAKEELKEASPISQVSHVPTLTFQGTLDVLVNKHQSITLDSVLTAKDIPHELVLIKGAGHVPRFEFWWRKNIIQPKLLEFIRKDFSEE